MERNINLAPLALPAAQAWVPAYLPALADDAAAAAAFTARAERCERREHQISGTTLNLVQPSRAQVRGTSGLAIKVSTKGMDPVGGVRGIPPRGWPV